MRQAQVVARANGGIMLKALYAIPLALITLHRSSIGVRQEGDVLSRLTPPAGVLPASCKPLPALGKDALYGRNPTVVTDTPSISIVHMYAMAAGVAADRPAAAAYAAFYREDGGSPQIGVYALRFNRDLTTAETDAFKANRNMGGASALRLVKGPVAVFAFSNARPDAPDKGCYEALRKHIETVEFK